jgi:hypothetical protein
MGDGLGRGMSRSAPPFFEGFLDLSPPGDLIEAGLREVRFRKLADV